MAGLPQPIPEHRFHPTRKWRFDYAFVDALCWDKTRKLALEIDGGLWVKGGGGHNHPVHYLKDMEKKNEAAALGWRIVTTTPSELKSWKKLGLLAQILRRAWEA